MARPSPVKSSSGFKRRPPGRGGAAGTEGAPGGGGARAEPGGKGKRGPRGSDGPGRGQGGQLRRPRRHRCEEQGGGVTCRGAPAPSCARRSRRQPGDGQSACSLPAPRAQGAAAAARASASCSLAHQSPGAGRRRAPSSRPLATSFSPPRLQAGAESRQPIRTEEKKREASGPACRAAYKRGGRERARGSLAARATCGRTLAR